MSNDPPKDLLDALLNYDPTTGEVRWKRRTPETHSAPEYTEQWNERWAGKVAGVNWPAKCGKLYRKIKVHSRGVFVHRAVLIIHGFDLAGRHVDHIDGNGLNNRLENLRVVTREENGRNQRLKSTNTSGVNGVTWRARDRVWIARGHHEGRVIHIGSFRDFSAAVTARADWQATHGFHPNHGTDRPL